MGDKKPYQINKRFQNEHPHIVIRGTHTFSFGFSEQFGLRETIEYKVYTDKTFADTNYVVTSNLVTKAGGYFDARCWVRDRLADSFVVCIENTSGQSAIVDAVFSVTGKIDTQV